MEFSSLSNNAVKSALKALASKNLDAWYALFTDQVRLVENGKEGDFKTYFDEAMKYSARFLHVEKENNNGLEVIGEYFAGRGGRFRASFTFQQNEQGKLNHLEIQQLGLTMNEKPWFHDILYKPHA